MEPLKNIYTPALLTQVAKAIQQHAPDVDVAGFVAKVTAPPWEQLELKQRLRHLSTTLHAFLPDDYERAVEVLAKASRGFEGYPFLFFADYVEQFGVDDTSRFNASIAALSIMTQYASAEFAVRPFIERYPDKMMTQMHVWSRSDNEHHRRLASEGCRPRLPWASALNRFKQDPSPILPILETLKADPSLYVRKSVANNLNDIGKDHPQTLLKLATRWHGQHPHTDWIVKHACRNLLKQAHPEALSLFGYGATDAIELHNFDYSPIVQLGEQLSFSFRLAHPHARLGKLRIEFAIGFLKARGQHQTKVFKIAEADYDARQKHWQKHLTLKPLTTRKLYPGKHTLSLILNGKTVKETHFELIFPPSANASGDL